VSAAARRIRTVNFDDTARFIVVFAALLCASAALSFAYTKDEIMSAAGAFYALAAFGACRDRLLTVMTAGRMAAVASILGLGLLVTGWSVRSAGVHYVLRSQAAKHQVDWLGQSDQWRRPGRSAMDAARNSLIQQLKDQSLAAEFPNPRLGPAWPTRIWMD